jgi:hypothetical protein
VMAHLAVPDTEAIDTLPYIDDDYSLAAIK